MTNTPRRESDGKPLPSALRDPVPEWIDEDTVPDRWTADELDAHLAQRAEAGQGGDDLGYRKGPL